MNLIVLILFGASVLLSLGNKKAGYIGIIVSSVVMVILEGLQIQVTDFFFLIAGVVWTLTSWYSIEYDTYERWLVVLYTLSIFGMALVLLSNNYIQFLAGWEVMSLGGYAIIGLNSRRAGTAFLFSAFSEFSTVLIVAGFAYAYSITGTINFTYLGNDIPLLLVSLGFIMKMGLLPFMLSEWLPISHGSAPANASVLLSATMTLMGVYGILKVTLLSPSNMPIGMFFMGIGAFTVFFAALLAYTAEGTKVLPGFSTIENNGGILVALGLVMAITSQYERGFLISIVLLYSLAHSVSKTGLFMISGNSGERVFSRRSSGKDRYDQLGGILVVSSLSGLLPTLGGVAVWMLLESLFMQSTQFQVLGIFSIIVGSLIALGEGLISGAMIKFISFTQLLKEKRAEKISLSLPVLSAGILVVSFGVASTLFVSHPFVSGNISLGIPYGFMIVSSLAPGTTFGVLTPMFILGLISFFFIVAVLGFGKPNLRRSGIWNGGVSLDSEYTSFAYSNNTRIMLKKILKPFSAETDREDGVKNIFWDSILSLGKFYRSFSRFITYKFMNSSMSWYVAYIIVAFVIVLVFAVLVY